MTVAKDTTKIITCLKNAPAWKLVLQIMVANGTLINHVFLATGCFTKAIITTNRAYCSPRFTRSGNDVRRFQLSFAPEENDCHVKEFVTTLKISLVFVNFCCPLRLKPLLVTRSKSQMSPEMNILVRRTIVVFSIGLLILLLNKHRRREGRLCMRFTVIDRIPTQIRNLSDLVDVSDEDCRDQLRMDRATFHKLCFMLQSVGGLKTSRRVTVTEKVAMFLSVLAHHTKNRCVKFQFKCYGQTVSKHFHAVLHCVLRMQSLFLVKPHPVNEDSTDVRWHKFPVCYSLLNEMDVDPLELELDEYMLSCHNLGDADDGIEMVDSLDTTPEWNTRRDSIAINMFNEWRNNQAV
ncbi:hypothetical protein ACS0TY_017145 [Phlomoides rotata]